MITDRQMRVDWTKFTNPIICLGNPQTAYRDPAAHYHEGVFRVFHSLTLMETDGGLYWHLAVIESRDLIDWSKPKILTPRDLNLNFSSPGNIVRVGDKWIICLQTYPMPNKETYANETARLWIMKSDDLVTWSEPQMLMVKGSDVPVEKMGRMIDPCLIRDKDDTDKWWCFYKQNGMSRSYTYDFKTWTYCGNTGWKEVENFCILQDGDEYVLFRSPGNGVQVMRSKDLEHWKDFGVFTLGQEDWPWAQGRLTAGFVLDLRGVPEWGKFLMFFHGATKQGKQMRDAHGHASLGFAWSDDLRSWHWAGKQ